MVATATSVARRTERLTKNPHEVRGRALLTRWRKRAKLSQGELSRRSGVPRSLITLYESGRRLPGVVSAAKLEVATRGAVPAISWLTAEQRRAWNAARRAA